MRHWKRWLFLVLAALIVGAIARAYMPKPIPVEIVRVARGPMEVTVPADGRTRVKDRYVVSAPVAGNVLRLELHPGDSVEVGAVLARIVPAEVPLLDANARAVAEARVGSALATAAEARAAIDRARAAEDLARTQSATSARLASAGSAPQHDADIAALELRTRSAEVQSAYFAARVADYDVASARAALARFLVPTGQRGELHRIDVAAPVRGRVLRVMHESAGVVAAGASLLELGDSSALEIAADVLTREAVHVAQGASVVLEDWGGDRSLRGRVRLVEPSAFTKLSALGVEEQRVNVVIDLEEPAETVVALGDGYQLTAEITTWRQDDVLQVPEGALFRRGEDWAVFVVRAGRAELRRVSVGHQNGRSAEVLRGLSPREEVIVHPGERVDDRALVMAE